MRPSAARVWLSIIMAGIFLKETTGKNDFIDGLVSAYLKQEGQLDVEGRTIVYTARVRPQIFPVIYDAIARDTASGLSSTAENFADPQDAYHKAVANLLDVLRHQGLIKDQSKTTEPGSSEGTKESDPIEEVRDVEPPVPPTDPDDKKEPSLPSDEETESPPNQPGIPQSPPEVDSDPNQDITSEKTLKDDSSSEEVQSSDPVPPVDDKQIEKTPGDEKNEDEATDEDNPVPDQLKDIGGVERVLTLVVFCASTATLKCIQSFGGSMMFMSLALALGIGSIYYWNGQEFNVFVACIVVLTGFLFLKVSPVFLQAMYQRVASLVHTIVKLSRLFSAIQEEGLLFEVVPDCRGSYDSYVMEAAQPTPDMLSTKQSYKMWSPCKGLAYILNNKDFVQGQRLGSEIDVQNMIHLFKELGYTIIQHNDLTGEEIVSSVRSFASMFNVEGVRYDSAVVVLMSHGDTGVIFGTDFVPVKLRDLQRRLEAENCPGLRGKPKLYFIQACRLSASNPMGVPPVVTDNPSQQGEGNDADSMEDTRIPNLQPDLKFISNIKDKSDVHFAFATVDGDWSLRSEAVGSFFVQALCEVFFKSAHQDNLDTLMNKVTDKVDRMRGYLYDNVTKQRVLVNQTPECLKSMRKALFFLPKYSKKKKIDMASSSSH